MKFNHWIFKFLPENIIAITLPWCVYFRYEKVAVHTIRHEVIHLNQKKLHGAFKFYAIYLKDYFKNLIKYRDHRTAYRNIPFEVEAYEKQFDTSIKIDQR